MAESIGKEVPAAELLKGMEALFNADREARKADDAQRQEERYQLGWRIFEISQAQRRGYLSAPNQFSTPFQEAQAEAAATAASNTGWFILKSLGYSQDELAAYRQRFDVANTPLTPRI